DFAAACEFGGRKGHPLPALLHIHFGGFILGSIEDEHAFLVAAALEAGAVVFTVDYRLAPEHPYPAALDDCRAGYRVILGNTHGDADRERGYLEDMLAFQVEGVLIAPAGEQSPPE